MPEILDKKLFEYVNSSKNVNKFWEILILYSPDTRGSEYPIGGHHAAKYIVQVRYGRNGHKGAKRTLKQFNTHFAADRFIHEKIRSKVFKGYNEVEKKSVEEEVVSKTELTMEEVSLRRFALIGDEL